MEPQRLVGRPVHADDHRRRYVGRLEEPAPLRDQLTVTGEDDRLGRIRRDVHRDLPTTVVLERLGDQLSRHRVSARRFRRFCGSAVGERHPRSLAQRADRIQHTPPNGTIAPPSDSVAAIA